MKMIARLCAALLLPLLLAACTISGPVDLVSEAESVTPLPAAFTFHPYVKQKEGGYALSPDDPMQFTQVGNQYESADGAMAVRFVPLDGDTYALAVIGEEREALYGTATLLDEVLVLRVVLDSGLTAEVADAIGDIPEEIAADLQPQRSGITITRRDSLDFVLSKVHAGSIPTSPLLGWIGADGADPPAMLQPEADWFEPTR
jgi:hypothetical protein